MTNRTSDVPGTGDIRGHSERQTRRLIQRANHPAGEPIWEHIRRPWWVRLINAMGAGLRRFGVRWRWPDAGTLLAAARRRSGRSDFGDGRFREGLGVLVDAFNARDDAPAFAGIVFSDLVSWKYRADHWVLKAPAHVSWLEELLDAFPDASVIVTHRDPLQVVPSWCSLMPGLRRIVSERLELHRLGAGCAEELPWRSGRMIAARTALDPARFLDVSYERMVADPISTIREACRHFGDDFTPEYDTRARRYIAENPRHKHGVHRYRLVDFGLDEATVNHQFADYRHWLAGRKLVAAY
jgi:hypothetical protein